MNVECYSDEEAELLELLVATEIEDIRVKTESSYHWDDGWDAEASCSRSRGLFHTDHFIAHATARTEPKARVAALERMMILIGQRSRFTVEALKELDKL